MGKERLREGTHRVSELRWGRGKAARVPHPPHPSEDHALEDQEFVENQS